MTNPPGDSRQMGCGRPGPAARGRSGRRFGDRAGPAPAGGRAARGVGRPACRPAASGPPMPRPCWRPTRPCSLLPEHGGGWFGRPGLSGHRLEAAPASRPPGRDWSPLFRPARTGHDGRRARVEAADADAGLRLVTEVEAVPGGAIRARHALTNAGRQPYVVDSLDVVFPLPGRVGEVLDFTGRRPPSGSRSATGSATACGCARGAAVTPATTRPPCWSPGSPGSRSATVRSTGCTWPGAATRCTTSSGCPPDTAGGAGQRAAAARGDHHRRRRAAAARRDHPGRGRVLRHALGLPGGHPAGLDGLSAQFHGYLRSRPAHPRLAPPGQPERVGSGLLPPRLRQAGRAGRPGRRPRRGTVRPGRRLVPRAPQRPGRARRLAGG